MNEMKKSIEKNDNSTIFETITRDQIFFCDYFSFQFCDENVRTEFVKVLQKLIGRIRLHEISLDSYDRFRIPPQENDSLVGLTSREIKKKDELFLSFYGLGAEKVEKVIFNEKILKFVNKHWKEKKGIQIKRLDYKVFLGDEVIPDLKQNSRELMLDAFKTQTSDQKNNQSDTQLISSSTGWTLSVREPSKRWKTRVYAYDIPEQEQEQEQTDMEEKAETSPFSQQKKKMNKIEKKKRGIAIEVQLSKTVTNAYTNIWREKDYAVFLLTGLKDFIKAVNLLKLSEVISIYKQKILPILERYINILDISPVFDKSLKSPLFCSTNRNEVEEFFYLESAKEFVAFIAIFRGITNTLKAEKRSLNSFKSSNYTDPESTRVFNFRLDTLIQLVGLPITPHYRIKMRVYLAQLQAYNVSFQSAKETSFHSLISSLIVYAGSVKCVVNLRVLWATVEPFSQINLNIYSDGLEQYTNFSVQKTSKTKTKTKTTYPNFFYPLLSQTIGALETETHYAGRLPQSGSAFKTFKTAVNWMFESLLPQFSDLKKEDLQVTTDKKKNQACIKTKRGKFYYPLFRKTNVPDNDLTITPFLLSIEGIEKVNEKKIKKLKNREETREKLKKEAIDCKSISEEEEIKKIKELEKTKEIEKLLKEIEKTKELEKAKEIEKTKEIEITKEIEKMLKEIKEMKEEIAERTRKSRRP